MKYFTFQVVILLTTAIFGEPCRVAARRTLAQRQGMYPFWTAEGLHRQAYQADGLRLDVQQLVLLDFLRACREASVPGRPGPNVYGMDGQRLDKYAATTINRRLAAISGLFTYVGLRHPDRRNPVPKGREAKWRSPGERSGLLAHTVGRPAPRSALRLREPRRLPTALSPTDAKILVESLRTWRDRAIGAALLGQRQRLQRIAAGAGRVAQRAQAAELALALAEQRQPPDITHLFSPTLVRRHSVASPAEAQSE